jgi:hypothetical protein
VGDKRPPAIFVGPKNLQSPALLDRSEGYVARPFIAYAQPTHLMLLSHYHSCLHDFHSKKALRGNADLLLMIVPLAI